jgi:hypothetical protein
MKLTSGCKAWFEKYIGIQSVKKLRLEGSLRFSIVIEAFGPQSWVSLSQPISLHPTSRRSTLIISIHLHIGLPCRFPTSYFVLNISSVCPTSLTFFILRHWVILTICQKSSNYEVLHSIIFTILLYLYPSINPGCLWHFATFQLLQWSIVSPTPSPLARVLSLVDGLWLMSTDYSAYIRSYPPHLDSIFIRNSPCRCDEGVLFLAPGV